MSPNRFFIAGFLAGVILVASCGDVQKAPPPKAAATNHGTTAKVVEVAARAPARPPADANAAAAMLALLPDNTFGLLYIPRLKDLGDGLERIVAATTGPNSRGANPFSLSLVVRKMGLDLDDFDLDRPLAIAMTKPVGATSEPGAVGILPARDENRMAMKLKARNPSATIQTADGFVVIVDKGAYKRAGASPAMSAPLPGGELVFRLDVPFFWRIYGELLTTALSCKLDSLGGEASEAAVKPVLDGLTSIAETATLCDVVMRIAGTGIEADATVHFAEGAKVPVLDLFSKSDLGALARALPDEGMMSCAMAVKPEALWSSFEPIATASLAASPEPARAVFEKAFDSVKGALKLLGGGMAVTGGFKDGRVELIGVVETPDPAAYLAAMIQITSELPADGSPVTVTPPKERTVGGMKVTTVRLKLDSESMPGIGSTAGAVKSREAMEAMFGKDPLVYNFVPLEKKILLVMGSDDVLERTLKACKAGADAAPTPLSKALAAAGADTVGYFSIDMAAVVRETMAIAARAGTSPTRRPPVTVSALETAPLTLILNAGNAQIRGRMTLDVGKTARLVMATMPR